jgi:uncharacterized protein
MIIKMKESEKMVTDGSKLYAFRSDAGKELIYSGITGLILEYNNRIKNFVEQKKDDEELTEFLFGEKANNNVFPTDKYFDTLMLFTTNKCNLTCSYCYERATDLCNTKEMNLATLKDTIVYFLENFSHPKVINIVFFGGEPLLNISFIKNSMELFNDFANKYNVRFSYGLTTNGTVFNDEVLELLLHNNIRIQVSIDGPENIHNSHRKFLNGQGSYENVVANVKKLSEYFDVSARVTITDYDIDLIKMYEELENKGFSRVKIECASDKSLKENSNELNSFSKRLRIFAQYFIDNIKHRKIIYFTDFLTHLKNLHFGNKPSSFPCQTGVSKYAIATDGSIYFCHRFNNIPEYKWGDVYNGLENEKRINFLSNHQFSVRANEKCNSCWALRACGGTCYHASYTECGDTNLISNSYCEFRKQIFEKSLYIYGSLSEENKIFLDNMKNINL